MNDQHQNTDQSIINFIEKAQQYALDVERYARLEASQSQLSPTDLAFLSRIVTFLRYEVPQQIDWLDKKNHM